MQLEIEIAWNGSWKSRKTKPTRRRGHVTARNRLTNLFGLVIGFRWQRRHTGARHTINNLKSQVLLWMVFMY